MKNLNKLKAMRSIAGIIALVAVISFAFVACGGDGNNNTPGGNTPSLNGVWQTGGGGLVVTISGNSGVITQISGAGGAWQDAINKGYVSVGGQYFRNIAKTGDLTWTGQVLVVVVVSTAPNVATGTDWSNCTFTLSANGQTLQCSTPDGTSTFTSGGGNTPGWNTPGTGGATILDDTWTNTDYSGVAQEVTLVGSNWTLKINGANRARGTMALPDPNATTGTVSFTVKETWSGSGWETMDNQTATVNYVMNSQKTTVVFSNLVGSSWFNVLVGTWTKGDGGTTPGGNTPSGEGGTFTLTGIPSQYNGMWAYLETENSTIAGAQTVNTSTEAYTLSPISNGSVSIPMWKKSGSTITRYSGNDTIAVGVGIFNVATSTSMEDPITGKGFYSVTFSNGSATRAWSDGVDFDYDDD